jgi:hypothetical protein
MAEKTIYEMVNEINQYLTVLIGKQNLYDWWDSPNKALEGKTPLESLPGKYEILLNNIRRAHDQTMNGDYS